MVLTYVLNVVILYYSTKNWGWIYIVWITWIERYQKILVQQDVQNICWHPRYFTNFSLTMSSISRDIGSRAVWKFYFVPDENRKKLWNDMLLAPMCLCRILERANIPSKSRDALSMHNIFKMSPSITKSCQKNFHRNFILDPTYSIQMRNMLIIISKIVSGCWTPESNTKCKFTTLWSNFAINLSKVNI